MIFAVLLTSLAWVASAIPTAPASHFHSLRVRNATSYNTSLASLPEPQLYPVPKTALGIDFLTFEKEANATDARDTLITASSLVSGLFNNHQPDEEVAGGVWRLATYLGITIEIQDPHLTYGLLQDTVLGLRQFFELQLNGHFFTTRFSVVQWNGGNQLTVASGSFLPTTGREFEVAPPETSP